MTVTAPATAPESRRLVRPALQQALDRLDPGTRRVCAYHLGYADAEGNPADAEGKQIRATLALLSARAAGRPAQEGVPAAVACELVHNFSLLHDDVMDRDTERRHRPTAWCRFGTPAAILAGDAMVSLAGEVLAEAQSPAVAEASHRLHATTRRLIAGQQADLAFESREQVSTEECLAMAGDKTGALLACSASLGAVLVDAPPPLAIGLAEYGARLGLAFQLVDDLLGIWGSTERTGKPVWSDLRSRKQTLPVVAAITSETSAGRRLAKLYTTSDAWTEGGLAEAAALVEEAGGRAWAQQRAVAESDAALAELDRLDLPADVHDELTTLTHTLSGRDH